MQVCGFTGPMESFRVMKWIQPSSQSKYSWKCFTTTEMKVCPLGWFKHLNQITVIVLFGHGSKWLISYSSTLPWEELWDSVITDVQLASCVVLKPFKVSLIWTVAPWLTGSLPSSTKNSFQCLELILTVTVVCDNYSTLSQSQWVIQIGCTFF